MGGFEKKEDFQLYEKANFWKTKKPAPLREWRSYLNISGEAKCYSVMVPRVAKGFT